MTKAIVICSGGMDSTTLAYDVLNDYTQDVSLLSFYYGQRHSKELDFAEATADRLGLEWNRVDLSSINALIQSSALTNSNIDVPEGHYSDDTMKITVVPNRNAMMLNVAIAAAVAQKASLVFTGVHAGDHAVYPDCRPEFIVALNNLAHVANEGFMDPYFTVSAPYIHRTKAQIAQLGEGLKVPWDQTWSCYKGGDIHCGRCSTCLERMEAFFVGQVEDPTEYEDTGLFAEMLQDGRLG